MRPRDPALPDAPAAPPAAMGPRLENRLPAEGINSSDEHPLREFSWLVGASVATLLAVVLVVGWGARWAAPRLPFATEVRLAERLVDRPQAPEHAARSAALQALADRVAGRMNLPPGMTLLVQYEPGPMINAYATLGGRIRVFEGLLRALPSEDALVALLAHEIAHVKHRHVAANAGRGLALALLLGAISADAGAAAAQGALGQAAGLALLGYSREQEDEADAAALAAVVADRGHGRGLVDLFQALGQAQPEPGAEFAMLRTHPLTADRLEAIRRRAADAGWSLNGPARPLPAELSAPAPRAADR